MHNSIHSFLVNVPSNSSVVDRATERIHGGQGKIISEASMTSLLSNNKTKNK